MNRGHRMFGKRRWDDPLQAQIKDSIRGRRSPDASGPKTGPVVLARGHHFGKSFAEKPESALAENKIDDGRRHRRQHRQKLYHSADKLLEIGGRYIEMRAIRARTHRLRTA